ncbi:MAG: hypothetical protein ACPGUC_10625 [Gammaproteobacteria bacterium]
MSDPLSHYHRAMTQGAWFRRFAFIAALSALVVGPGGGYWWTAAGLALAVLALVKLKRWCDRRAMDHIRDHARGKSPQEFVVHYQNPTPPQDPGSEGPQTRQGVICEVHPVAPMGGQGSFKLVTSDGITEDWLIEGEIDGYAAGRFVEIDYVETQLDPRKVRRFNKKTGEETPALASDLVMQVPLEIRLSADTDQLQGWSPPNRSASQSASRRTRRD